jgi:hypothetical protein
MARKRKRAVSAIAQADTEAKRPKLAASLDKKIQYHTSASGQFPAAILHVYYSQVISLRQFLLSKLPASSTSKRRLLSGLGRERPHRHGTDNFFDSTLIGVLKEPQELIQEARKRDFANFTQASQQAASGTKGSTQSYQVEEVSQFYVPCLLGSVPLRRRPMKIEEALMTRSDCGLCNLGLILESYLWCPKTTSHTLLWISTIGNTRLSIPGAPPGVFDTGPGRTISQRECTGSQTSSVARNLVTTW